MRKIGIYGGTFDPVHHAHLILAREALEQMELERVWFIPAALSPHKVNEKPTAPALRGEMLRAAIAGEKRFAVDERELQRPAPSFTIDTIEALRREDSQRELFYLIGSDQLGRLEAWHRIDELRRLVTFVVLDRTGSATGSVYRKIHRPLDISSTEIRNRVARGQPIRYLVPAAVEEIIRRESLYQDTTRSPRNN